MGERQPQSIIGKTTWEITRRVLRPEVEGIQNFATAREHLRRGGSIIGYANDPSEKKDIPSAGSAIEDNLTSLNHFGVFVSRRQVDSSIGLLNCIQNYFLINKWAKSPGVTMIRVVQPKDRERYPDWAEFNNDAFERATEFAKTPGNVFVVTPEGERSKDGLKEAEVGAAALFRDAREIALAMPIAIPYKASKIIAGTPFSWEDSLKDHQRNPGIKIKDRMMARLALILPLGERGVYTQMASEFIMPPATNWSYLIEE